jgi:CDGSH-type Zn-finger protein
MIAMKIEILDKGPYVVKGNSTIVNKDGSVVENTQDVYLCRCGHSKNKPHCDGAHRNIDFD